MKRGYIKLWRKIGDGVLMQDHTALVVFLDILLSADRFSGQAKVSRYVRSKNLELKPTTWYAALRRLEKWKMVTLVGGKRFTTVSICNWDKYQSPDDTADDTSMTPDRHLDDTLYIHKNRELRIKNKENTTNVVLKKIAKAHSPTPKEFFENLELQDKLIMGMVAQGANEQYSRNELKKFIAYWREMNVTGTKERWQMEKVFELKRRLSTWFAGAKDYKKTNRGIVKLYE